MLVVRTAVTRTDALESMSEVDDGGDNLRDDPHVFAYRDKGSALFSFGVL